MSSELERQLKLYADALIRAAAAAAVNKSGARGVPILTSHMIAAGRIYSDGSRALVEFERDGLLLTPDEWIAEARRDPHLGRVFGDGEGTADALEKPLAVPRGNPFEKGPDFNLTEQMKIQKSDPALATRLKALAAQ